MFQPLYFARQNRPVSPRSGGNDAGKRLANVASNASRSLFESLSRSAIVSGHLLAASEMADILTRVAAIPAVGTATKEPRVSKFTKNLSTAHAVQGPQASCLCGRQGQAWHLPILRLDSGTQCLVTYTGRIHRHHPRMKFHRAIALLDESDICIATLVPEWPARLTRKNSLVTQYTSGQM